MTSSPLELMGDVVDKFTISYYYLIMPRLSRIDAPGLLQHVIVRGIEKGTIFLDDEDRQDFIRRMAKLLPETGIKCFAWALLTNHFHLLLRPLNQPLATFMRRLLTGYAVYFNRRHDRSGHLFQNRYKSFVCEKDAYLLELVRYIHLNPLRAGIVNNMNELDVYPWSGHAALVGNAKNEWQEYHEVMSLFGYKITNYRTFINEGADLEDNLKNLNISPAAGFEPLEKSNLELMHTDKINCKYGLANTDIFPFIIAATLDYYSLTEDSIRSRSKSSDVSSCRAVIAYLAQEKLGMMGADIAASLGLTRSAVSRLVQRGRKIALRDKSLFEKLNLI